MKIIVKTIKAKLIVLFMIIMFSLVLSGIILHSIGFKSYYIDRYKSVFLAVANEIEEKYPDNNYSDYVINIRDIENISTTIADENYRILYNTNLAKVNRKKLLNKRISNTILENKQKLTKNYMYYINESNNKDRTTLVFISQLSTGDYVILRKPIKNIIESVLIANQFYVVAGVIVIFIGSIFIIIFSRRITRPIIEMSKVAENIANLEFDKRVTITSEDEIATLGESINKISEKLSTSIIHLKNDVESRKQLIRDLSHELKTPIGIIKGYAEGLKYGVVTDEAQMQKYCTVLVEECDRMDRLVRELLDVSAIEAGGATVNITKFELNEFLLQIVGRFQSIFDNKGITFQLHSIENCVISADKVMLEKAINNFITNAIHYVEGRKCIELWVNKSGSGIVLSVFNTGSYIPEEECKKIWDIFYKVDKARTRKYGGNGVGLAIVKSVMQLHGGKVYVKNVGDGVKFSLYLPQ